MPPGEPSGLERLKSLLQDLEEQWREHQCNRRQQFDEYVDGWTSRVLVWITDCVAELTAERADTDPKVFTKIHVHFIVTGKNLNPRQVERAIKLSAEKYCSASIMLGKTAQMTHDFEIREAA